MNGYDTEIFEMHNISGGLCTSWKRNGYTFDGCIHSMAGTNPNYKVYKYWNELIDMEKIKFFYHDVLASVENENGNIVKFYTDPDKLEKELKSIAPEDTAFIEGFIKDVKQLAKYDNTPTKPIELWNPLDYYLSQFKNAPIMKQLVKWQKSMKDLTEKCKSPLLKKLLNSSFFSHYPAYFLLFSIGHLHNKNSAYPIGGSLQFAKLIENRYSELGGKIHYKSKVTKINVKNNQAIGVTLENGETHNDANIVISAADGYDTIFNMLEGKYINKKIINRYNEHPRWDSAVIVYLGVARTFENEPDQIDLTINNEITIDDKTKLNNLSITIYNFDPTLADKGKTVVRTILGTYNYEYWSNLRKNDNQKYNQEKQRIAKEIITILDKRLGNIANNVEVIDVVTPETFKRYTNNWQGSIQGWDWLPGLIPETIKKELPNLKNFYMIGQWVMPGGGVSSALTMGRDITRIICKKDRKKFKTFPNS